MSTKQPMHSVPREVQPSCTFSLDKEGSACINTFSQLDFAATLAALVGVPFPFGSIGRVNSELFGLVAGTWPTSTHESVDHHKNDWSEFKWMEHYHAVLCVNSWQVNRYFELYSESSLSGFPSSDLFNIHNLYSHAQSFVGNQLQLLTSSETEQVLNESMTIFSGGIDAYSRYLEAAAALSRSKWTHFRTDMMAFGLVIFASAFAIHIAAFYNVSPCGNVGSQLDLEDCSKLLPIKEILSGGLLFSAYVTIGSVILSLFSLLLRGSTPLLYHMGFIIFGGFILGTAKSYILSGNSLIEKWVAMKRNLVLIEGWRCDPRGVLAVFSVAIYAFSLLSNSYILKEGKVVNFLLASSGILDLRHALQRKCKVFQAFLFLGFNFVLGHFASINIFKDTEAIADTLIVEEAVNTIASERISVIWQLLSTGFTAFLPLMVLGFFFVKSLQRSSLLRRSYRWVISVGIFLNYTAISLHWLLDDLIKLRVVTFPETAQDFLRLQIPRMVYLLVAVLFVVLVHMAMSIKSKYRKVQFQKVLEETSIPCLAVWSGLTLLLLGRHGPLIALIAGMEGWCLVDMQSLSWPAGGAACMLDLISGDSVRSVQWSLFSMQLFFCTGHRCAFDGLRYAAAFIGFDQFNIYRQGILLTADTFGASHVLPVVGLPLLVTCMFPGTRNVPSTTFYKLRMSQAFLVYGLVRVTTTILTTICVTIQRRHLMVWGLFAPKFVFDASGLLVTDIALVSASLYYLLPFSG